MESSGKSRTQVATSIGAGVLCNAHVRVVSSIAGAPLKSQTPAEYTSTGNPLFSTSETKMAWAITLRHLFAVQIRATEIMNKSVSLTNSQVGKGSSAATPPLQRSEIPLSSFQITQAQSCLRAEQFFRASDGRYAGAGASLRSTPSPPERSHTGSDAHSSVNYGLLFPSIHVLPAIPRLELRRQRRLVSCCD